ncbi:MAG: DUF4139 domain-containing protein [Flavobacteriia bacterium]|nr:DUF4139 domain-containing protein [Flavobacteriia bacterium]
MKKNGCIIIAIVFAFFFQGFAYGQKINEQVIKSEIKKVKLFLTAGEMYHEASIKLLKGRNKIIFSGISTYADPQSIQFNAEGNYRIVSISTEMDFLAAEMYNPRIKKLSDSLDNLKDKLQYNEDMIASFQSELAVLEVNQNLKGDNQNLTVAQLKEVAEFYRTRTFEINQKLTKLNREQLKMNAQIENVRLQLLELNYSENLRSNQVIVLLDADVSISINGTIKYLVSDCGWAATYDLSATDINQKINLKYKAKVYNNTGNDWNDVDLILSTGDPNLSAAHPELVPWYLSYYNTNEFFKKKAYYAPQNVQYDYHQQAVSNMNMANTRVYESIVLEEKDKNSKGVVNNELRKSELFWGNAINGNLQLGVGVKQIEVSQLTTEFEIASKFSCPSDAKPYTVNVKEMNLDATFSYVCVPKMDHAAFLIANIVGWQDLDLIPGSTNVYFSGVYVGISEIDTKNVNDTLSLSFGRDNKVQVMRKLKKELSSKRVVGNSKKDSYLYEIVVRNNRNVPIKIDIFDQVPISTNGDITVAVDNISGAAKDEVTGETKWAVTIQPAEVKSYEIGFTIKYPKEADIKVEQFRTISCPSF